MFYIFSTLVLFIIALGLRYRKQAKYHIPLMLGAFVIDLILVLVIEIQRQAVEKVAGEIAHGTNYFLIFHATISLLVLVFYLMLIYSGSKLYSNLRSAQAPPMALYARHKTLAKIFIVLRLINYATSFGL